MEWKRVTRSNLKMSKSITHTQFTLCYKTLISSFQTVLMISILITDTVTIHSAWKVQQSENVYICVCVCVPAVKLYVM